MKEKAGRILAIFLVLLGFCIWGYGFVAIITPEWGFGVDFLTFFLIGMVIVGLGGAVRILSSLK